jgi:hypothetical protein
MLGRALGRRFAQLVAVKEGWIHLPVPGSPASVQLTSVPLSQAVGEIKALGFNEVEFSTLSGVKYSAGSLLSQLATQAFHLRIDKHNFQVVPELPERTSRTSELLNTMTLSFNEKEVLGNYLSKLAALVSSRPQGDLSIGELHKFMEEALPREKTSYGSRQEMEAKLKEYTAEYEKLTRFDQKFNIKARRHAMRVVWSGLAILLAQWAYVGSGTFIYYSWDVMEPQAYLIGLGNVIVGMAFYILKRREFAMESVIAALKEAKMRQLYQRKGINTARVLQLREYIDAINRVIKQ